MVNHLHFHLYGSTCPDVGPFLASAVSCVAEVWVWPTASTYCYGFKPCTLVNIQKAVEGSSMWFVHFVAEEAFDHSTKYIATIITAQETRRRRQADFTTIASRNVSGSFQHDSRDVANQKGSHQRHGRDPCIPRSCQKTLASYIWCLGRKVIFQGCVCMFHFSLYNMIYIYILYNICIIYIYTYISFYVYKYILYIIYILYIYISFYVYKHILYI